MAGTITASIVKDPSSPTNNLLLGATGNVTLGADTTATGALSVGGLTTLGASGIRMVNGSNTTNIVAPSTAVTTTLTLPATTGTLAYVNSNVLPAYDGSQLLNTGGMTSLGTLSTPSGSSQSLSGLTLTSYRKLYVVFNGVNVSAGGPGGGTLSMGGAAISGSNSAVWNGYADVDLTVGVFISILTTSATGNSAASSTATSTSFSFFAGRTTFTTASTAFTVTVATGTFGGGSIAVYGVK